MPVNDMIPTEGATGWADTWMLSAKSKHPNCAYKWMAWVSTPQVQAQQAIFFGETPANTKACAVMDKLSPGSCAKYHLDAPASYFNTIKFWKTPSTDCGNGKNNCMDYNEWQQAWTEIKGCRCRYETVEAGRPPGRPAVACRPSSGAGRGCARSRCSCCRSAPSCSSMSPRSPCCSSSAFWTVDSFTGKIVHAWSLDNFSHDLARPRYWRIALRTIGIAAAVTVTDVVLAFPFAYYMARVAGPRLRTVLFVLVLLPLWSSYLARIYSWRLILANDGALNWWLSKLGLPDQHIAYTNWAMWIVFSYIWLPFMILPVYASLERIPNSYIEASGDLGARGWTTCAA